MKTSDRVLLSIAAVVWMAISYPLFIGLGYGPCCGYAPQREALLTTLVASIPLWLPVLVPARLRTTLLVVRSVCALLIFVPMVAFVLIVNSTVFEWLRDGSVADGWPGALVFLGGAAALVLAVVVMLAGSGGLLGERSEA